MHVIVISRYFQFFNDQMNDRYSPLSQQVSYCSHYGLSVFSRAIGVCCHSTCVLQRKKFLHVDLSIRQEWEKCQSKEEEGGKNYNSSNNCGGGGSDSINNKWATNRHPHDRITHNISIPDYNVLLSLFVREELSARRAFLFSRMDTCTRRYYYYHCD